MEYKLSNGWTKEKVMEQIKKYNNNTRAIRGTQCQYKDENGNRCAIGCFIPDEHNGLGFQGGVGDLLKNYPDLKLYMPLDDIMGLESFQVAHDESYSYGQDKTKIGLPVYPRIVEWLEENVE